MMTDCEDKVIWCHLVADGAGGWHRAPLSLYQIKRPERSQAVQRGRGRLDSAHDYGSGGERPPIYN